MSTTLLSTKFFIPSTRPELVSRPRLVKRLNEGLHRKLTLISAPAGFGKTTLVSEWVENLRLDPENKILIAWLSLDESDNDPSQFLSYFITALNRVEGVEAALGESVLTMLQPPQPPPTEAILTSIINEISAIPDRIILVLDDYHIIGSSQVDDALAFFLEHLPPQMHLVIVTRVDPHLALASLHAKDQLTELRAKDLRFTSSEATEFLNHVMSLDLSPEDIATLETRTEGWITGLHLAAISMQGHDDPTNLIKSFTGSHRLVLDYLIEEVLNQQSESVQSFLLKTAILNRLTCSLCDAITGQDNGQQNLEMLEQRNLFIIPLDNERRWYRYNHLFADLLNQRLTQTQPEQVPILHRWASEWYEQNGFVDEALDHALRAEDFKRLANLIEAHVDALWQRGEYANLQRWLAGLPSELVFSKPHLCILQAWDLFHSGHNDPIERSLLAAEKALESSLNGVTGIPLIEHDQLSDTDRMKVLGRAAVIRAYLAVYRGDVKGIIKYSRQALEHLPEQDTWRSTTTIALGDAYVIKGDIAAAYQTHVEAVEMSKETGHIYLILIANGRLAETLRHQGKLKQVIDLCRQQMQYANECGISQTVAAGWILAIWGEVLAELNSLDLAINQAKKGVKLAERGGRDVAFFGWSCLYLVRVLFSRGDMSGAEEVIQKMENFVLEYDIPFWVPVQINAWQARIWLEQDKLETASQWVRERGLDANGEISFLHEIEYVVLARILIAQGKIDEATRLLQRMLEAAEVGGRTSRVIEIMMLQALALQGQGETEQAFTKLEKALTFAEPEGFIRIFVDEGSPMEALLKRIKVEERRIKEYVRKLLAAFSNKDPHPSPLSPQPLIEPLSERELEVLQLLAEGLTNQEIASRLFLSLNTIKVHTRNIYGKLGVNNRTQAAARAKELDILP